MGASWKGREAPAIGERAYPADFVHLWEALGGGDDPGDLSREYVDGGARSVRCLPEVREGLEALRGAGRTLGIATNGAGDIQRAKLAATGLASYSDGICVSEGIGAMKPAYEHFVEAAAELCSVRPSSGGWMVGDNAETDIGGGARRGFVRRGRPMAVHGAMAPVSPISRCGASRRPSRRCGWQQAV
ncbi:HAD family hydrolase [Streptomyces sp. GbtcB6]|uniref:HAD family hydrolase n=1 Tax=Streptomyces sp. GbtcB6 TaxID=2824751 RepID=UPI001C2F9626